VPVRVLNAVFDELLDRLTTRFWFRNKVNGFGRIQSRHGMEDVPLQEVKSKNDVKASFWLENNKAWIWMGPFSCHVWHPVRLESSQDSIINHFKWWGGSFEDGTELSRVGRPPWEAEAWQYIWCTLTGLVTRMLVQTHQWEINSWAFPCNAKGKRLHPRGSLQGINQPSIADETSRMEWF
jgi:hypothetical protein